MADVFLCKIVVFMLMDKKAILLYLKDPPDYFGPSDSIVHFPSKGQ